VTTGELGMLLQTLHMKRGVELSGRTAAASVVAFVFILGSAPVVEGAEPPAGEASAELEYVDTGSRM
jgi:hypothetical protein